MHSAKSITHAVIIISSCAVLLGAVGLSLIGFLASEKLQQDNGSQFHQSPDAVSGEPAPDPLEPLVVPTSTTGQPHESIQQAIARCEADAAKDSESFHFLLTPVFPLNFESATLLMPPGDHQGPFYLIQSQLVLSGLQDRSIEVSSRPYEVSLIDSQTGRIQKWDSTIGSAQFKLPNAVLNFRIGLQFEDDALTWSEEYHREPGSCYRVNVFLARQVYSPPPGQLNFAVLKSFPSAADTLRCANHVCELESRLSRQDGAICRPKDHGRNGSRCDCRSAPR
jgi:hypothetical protein